MKHGPWLSFKNFKNRFGKYINYHNFLRVDLGLQNTYDGVQCGITSHKHMLEHDVNYVQS